MTGIIQHRIFDKIELSIECDGIRAKSRGMFDYNEELIPFERITKRVSIAKGGNNRGLHIFFLMCLLVIVLSSMGIYIMNIPLGLIGIVFLLCFFYSYKSVRFIACVDGRSIILFDSKPSKEQVDEFIQTLYCHRNVYLKRKYTKLDLDFPFEDQLYKLKWLYEEDVITEEEYEKSKKEFTDKKKGTGTMGFFVKE